ncbi:MAG: sugar MFS transporter [Hyphomonadaceae bacterium]|nr:MAG: MFS transporter FHS family L-fucose permease [Caulobacteraceae bacterium]MBT9445668.1 sugar MFS transporter [Hyphomonadaceae bacterium]
MASPQSAAAPGVAAAKPDRTLFVLSLGLFFLWGFATVLIDILVPKLKGLFTLSYTEAMLTQFAFFIGYFVFSLPAGVIVGRIGYMRGIVVGLVIMTIGCLLFAPAARMGVYEGFLLALFIMSGGITILQVAANAVISIAGAEGSSSARLTLAQAFNSFGTFIGPIIGARLILGGETAKPADVASMTAEQLSSMRIAEAASVQTPFLGIAALLVVLVLVFWFRRNLLPRTEQAPASGLGLNLLGRPRVLFGVIAIFAYVGAEVSIGSILVNYLMQPSRLDVVAVRAGELVSFYWGGAMVGRFLGAAVLRSVNPGHVLMACALGAISLAVASAYTTGLTSAVAILAIGLMNSIMFPTIFSQSLKGIGEDAPKAAGLLCMAIVGGAILPVITGAVADRAGLSIALIVPILGYLWIVFFGRYTART